MNQEASDCFVFKVEEMFVHIKEQLDAESDMSGDGRHVW